MWTNLGVPGIRIWLIALGLIVIVAINAVLALVLTRYVTDRFLLREGQVAQEFLNGIIAAEGSAGKLFDTPAPSPALVFFAAHVRSLPGTVRANIYSPDGFIRYSTEANLIGLQFSANPELTESFGGELISGLEEVSGGGKQEHLALNQFSGDKLIEAYIPIAGEGGKTVAVVEFYKKATGITEIVSGMTRIIWTAAGLSGLTLFAALFGAVTRGARLMKRDAGG